MKTQILVTAATLGLTFAGAAFAEAPSDWYAGVSVGQSRATNIDIGELNDYLRSRGLTNPSSSASKNDSAYRILGGYRFNPSVAIEAMYTDLGSFSTRSSGLQGGVNADYKVSGYGIAAVLSAPLTQDISIFGRVGAIRADTKANFSTSGGVSVAFNQGSSRKTGNHYGFGVQYDLNRNLALRAEIERYRKLGDSSTGGELETDVGSIGAIFRF